MPDRKMQDQKVQDSKCRGGKCRTGKCGTVVPRIKFEGSKLWNEQFTS